MSSPVLATPAGMRRDALPLSPAELIAVRKLLGSGLPEYVEATEAARRLSLDIKTLRRLIRAGNFPGTRKISTKKVLVPVGEIVEWLEKHRVVSVSLTE